MNKSEFKIASPAELQAIYENTLREQRSKYGAASTTVDALMFSLRARGLSALKEPNCQRRLAELSPAQVNEIITRLIALRPQYPAINDELLFLLSEQLQ